MEWWVYLVRCADGTLYCGLTRDTEGRLRQHNGLVAGGARYTAGRRPVTLVWSEAHESRSKAAKREAAIKGLPRILKEALIA
jgi:putative endonuclease